MNGILESIKTQKLQQRDTVTEEDHSYWIYIEDTFPLAKEHQ
jgi:hypothetical protein